MMEPLPFWHELHSTEPKYCEIHVYVFVAFLANDSPLRIYMIDVMRQKFGLLFAMLDLNGDDYVNTNVPCAVKPINKPGPRAMTWRRGQTGEPGEEASASLAERRSGVPEPREFRTERCAVPACEAA